MNFKLIVQQKAQILYEWRRLVYDLRVIYIPRLLFCLPVIRRTQYWLISKCYEDLPIHPKWVPKQMNIRLMLSCFEMKMWLYMGWNMSKIFEKTLGWKSRSRTPSLFQKNCKLVVVNSNLQRSIYKYLERKILLVATDRNWQT